MNWDADSLAWEQWKQEQLMLEARIGQINLTPCADYDTLNLTDEDRQFLESLKVGG